LPHWYQIQSEWFDEGSITSLKDINQTKKYSMPQEFTQTQLYSCGNNEHYQNAVGIDNESSFISTPTTPVFATNIDNEKIIQVALGSDHSIVLTESGKCFAGGLYCYGQTSLKSELECRGVAVNPSKAFHAFEYIHTLSHVKVVHIACGQGISYFWTDEGKLFMCGYKITEQRFVYSLEEILLPEYIRTVKQLYANMKSCLLTADGNVYTYYNNIFKKVNGDLIIDKIACCEFTIVMRDINNDIYINLKKSNLIKIETGESTIVDFNCNNNYILLLNDRSELKVYGHDGVIDTETVIEYIDDCNTCIQTQAHATKVSIAEKQVAITYSDGHVRIAMFTDYYKDKYCLSQWNNEVSIPKCQIGAELVVAAANRYFMFYWKQNQSKQVVNFYHRLKESLSENLYCDIIVVF
jgi:hypothetical protein